MNLHEFIKRWKASAASERANKDSFLNDLCEVLGVSKPDPKTGDLDKDRYVFEREVILLRPDKQTIGFIDLYKYGHFILEAKQGSEADSKKIGTAKRGTPAWHVAMEEAFGKAVQYSSTIQNPPPFIIIADIGYCFDIYASFDGTRNYRKFPDAIASRIFLEKLESHLDTLRAIFTDPHALDPSKRAAKVTREIATYIAGLARELEDQGHAPELVAKFLMRCLFTMFAEDVELLPKRIFAEALSERWIENPDSFVGEVSDLWKSMNEGGALFGAGKIWRFNGGLFADPVALPLTKSQLIALSIAASQNWSDVEPAIFGTLLERALDPKERHRLGAHYTPRAYVERLVRPTIEEPIRAEWDTVRAQVQTLIAGADPEKNIKAVFEARRIVNEFHERLTRIRVLDPACGSGNFLYVALDLFKRIENEVIDLLANLGETRPLFSPSGRMVSPEQFLGIEIKPWAKEITELVLWIGYLQWQIRTRGWKSHPEEPILRDYHNIECRDAVVAYDDRVPAPNPEIDPPGSDEKLARPHIPIKARKAEWPQTEFIVGNPPFIGNKRMRAALGDEYVAALRNVHRDVPDTADYVMYWWNHAAKLAREGAVHRFGLITTNSITQTFNRNVLASHLNGDPPLSIVFAIPDHPWVDAESGSDVRIAMTVGMRGTFTGRLGQVVAEIESGQDVVDVQIQKKVGKIHEDLSIGSRVTKASPLKSNEGLAFMGVTLGGQGFVIQEHEVARFETGSIRSYLTGGELNRVPERRSVIDFYGLSYEDARENYPVSYQRILTSVKPDREQNNRGSYREKWWLFVENRPAMRRALSGLPRFIAICRTAKHRVFQFVRADALVESTIISIALSDGYALGVLSSRTHVAFSLRVGSRLGVGNDPRYNNTLCFDPFPFPRPIEQIRDRIRELAEQVDAHRKRQQQLHPDLTITGMYNVLEKLRSGESLTAKEKKIHEQGLVSVLKQIHDDLDAAVFDAYGWPHDLTDDEILERLVALNAERAEEEKHGIIRWLRPEFQNPEGIVAATQTKIAIAAAERKAKEAKKEKPEWPKELPCQIAAVRDLVTTAASNGEGWTADSAAKAFKGARRKDVESILDSLAALGHLIAFETDAGRRWKRPQ